MRTTLVIVARKGLAAKLPVFHAPHVLGGFTIEHVGAEDSKPGWRLCFGEWTYAPNDEGFARRLDALIARQSLVDAGITADKMESIASDSGPEWETIDSIAVTNLAW